MEVFTYNHRNVVLFSPPKSELHVAWCGWPLNNECWLVYKWAGTGKGVKFWVPNFHTECHFNLDFPLGKSKMPHQPQVNNPGVFICNLPQWICDSLNRPNTEHWWGSVYEPAAAVFLSTKKKHDCVLYIADDAWMAQLCLELKEILFFVLFQPHNWNTPRHLSSEVIGTWQHSSPRLMNEQQHK